MELNAIPAFTDVIEVTAMSARHLIEICFILTYLLTRVTVGYMQYKMHMQKTSVQLTSFQET